MVTKERVSKKQFNILIYKEKFYPSILKDTPEWEYMHNTQLHSAEVKGTSDDPEMQRFDSCLASMAIEPKAGDLIVTNAGEKYYIERYPNKSNSYVATVITMWKHH